MKRLSLMTLLIAAVAMSGCYHASISTGKTAGDVVVENEWASGWIYGLVPPKPIDVSSQCTNGIAMVETELSFLNQLVSGLTMGIFTPMHIKVTCASGSMSSLDRGFDSQSTAADFGVPPSPVVDIVVPQDASAEAKRAALGDAADLAVTSGSRVYVRFE